MTKSIFRIAVVAILCCMIGGTCLAVQGKTAFSTRLVSLSFINVELGEILKSIQSQTGLAFFYSNNVLNEHEKRTIKVSNVPVEQALSLLLDNKKFSWRINENARSIRISGKETRTATAAPVLADSTIKNGLSGRVTDAGGHPLIGATVRIRGTQQGAQADATGKFEIKDVPPDAIVQVSFTGYQQQELYLGGRQLLDVVLTASSNELSEVEVVSTGYQKLPRERATGSFAFVDNKLLNRSVSTNVLDRLDGVVSGVIFNKQANKIGGLSSNGGDPSISIRGRSTLFANTEPLIILDNFPYEGDPANINPNDIESVTVLKDAAAASIWGVRAGNGVIVMTSKKGKLNHSPVVSLNTNITIQEKPNIDAIPQISSADYVALERTLFNNGSYDLYLNFLPYIVQSPVIDILDKERSGGITHANAETQLAELSAIDYKKDYKKYFLRNQTNQQYNLSVNGGNSHDQYYISGGFDRNVYSQIPNDYNRFTLNARNINKMYDDRLEFTTDLLFIKSKSQTNPDPYLAIYPYEKIVDEKGNPLPVVRSWRQSYKDMYSNSNLLDWNYYPLKERKNNGNKTELSDYKINLGVSYKIIKNILSFGVYYQYQQGNINQTIERGTDTYSTRLLINQYAQLDPNGTITYPIPLGAIRSYTITEYKSNSGRLQLNYHKVVNKIHEINALAGFEVKSNKSYAISNILYGYNSENATSIPVDFFTKFPTRIGGGSFSIPNFYGQNGLTDRFVSYYANASYIFNSKYMFSISGRRDESNLFGVKANQRGVPLYSLGVSWEISKEDFYKLSFLPYLRFRLTDGYNGNLSKTLSSYTTARTGQINQYYFPTQEIINPPNPQLGWEKIHVINAAVDFRFQHDRLTGSLEFYYKNGENLFGNTPLAPQTGTNLFTGNTSSMKTKGVDVVINSVNIKGKISWTTNFNLSFVKDKITSYKYQAGVNSYYVSKNFSNPLVGKPYSAIFAYPFAGLDTLGNPQGYLNGKISEDYSAILNSTDINELKYIGTSTPTAFGSIRNVVSFYNFEMSFNITYKLGYYFRRGSYNSSSVSYQQADFEKRWKVPGDEKNTNVPGFQYPADGQRDQFYNGSTILVDKGDHFRLQDIQVGYNIVCKNSTLPFTNIRLYGYASNIGIIWRANQHKLDPDYVGNSAYTIPNPRSYSIGINANF